MKTNELYLKTLFCCSACDGEIASEEVLLVKKLSENDTTFDNLDIEKTLNTYVKQINEQGSCFLKDFLREISNAELSSDEQIKLIELAIKMIEADNQILYSEIRFFKKIRLALTITDADILDVIPYAEDYLLPDVLSDSKEDDWSNIAFAPISLSD